MTVIDHLVVAVPRLDDAIDEFEAATGVRPAAGGAHVGLGTHNALVSFGSGYVELIAPDPRQPDPPGGRPFGIDDLDNRRLVTFAVRPAPGGTIDDVCRSASTAGYEPGEPVAMSRRTPDGELLQWRLTFPRTSWSGIDLHGTVPFVIDWGDTPMPSSTAPGGLELSAVRIGHRDHETIAAAHRALDVAVDLGDADRPGCAARLSGPAGHLDV
ncbi:MAG: VOC family protein [Ilumatobacter sp.]|nr:VOC family protein [Ilumatobacter sp.]